MIQKVLNLFLQIGTAPMSQNFSDCAHSRQIKSLMTSQKQESAMSNPSSHLRNCPRTPSLAINVYIYIYNIGITSNKTPRDYTPPTPHRISQPPPMLHFRRRKARKKKTVHHQDAGIDQASAPLPREKKKTTKTSKKEKHRPPAKKRKQAPKNVQKKPSTRSDRTRSKCASFPATASASARSAGLEAFSSAASAATGSRWPPIRAVTGPRTRGIGGRRGPCVCVCGFPSPLRDSW